MGKKHKHPEHENLERWLVSYADFITLLFATFTALFAIASADLAKMEDVSAAIRQGFQDQSLITGIKSIIQGKSPPADNPNPLSSEKGAGAGVIGQFESMTYLPGEVKAAERTVSELMGLLAEINENIEKNAKQGGPPQIGEDDQGAPRGVELSVQARGIKVSFDSSLLFESGSAALKPEARKMLGEVSERLKPYSGRNLIQVEGHTDNVPIASAVYPSNWELSTARASAVVREMVKKHGFDPAYMSAAGFADSRPIADNKTTEGRQKNRRIDIILYSKMAGNEADPKRQYQRETSVIRSKGGLADQLLETHTNTDGPVRVIYQKMDEAGHAPKVITPSEGKPIDIKPVDVLKDQDKSSGH